MHDVETVIVGAGFSGIGAAIGLDRVGMSDYVVVEAGDEPGGTWYWNTYPGIAVDIPSFSYQFSFEQSSAWSRTYAHGHELKTYAEHCVDKYGLRPRIRFATTVRSADFDEAQGIWRLALDTADGPATLSARFLVNAGGVLTVPKLPDIAGVDSFAGVTMHTARWDHTQDLRGKRVAIIGTGASAVQVIPEIAPIVERLTVFQRTPIWCFPKFDVPLSKTAQTMMRLPFGKSLQRLISQAFVELTFPLAAQYFTVNPMAKRMGAVGRAYLRKQVDDPVLRDKLTPRYAVGCKRPGFHNAYLSTFNRDNVDLVTEPIDKITGSGVSTTDGSLHEVDVLILATGFKVFAAHDGDDSVATFPVTGPGGRSLARFWDDNRLQAYEGVSVPGFPNFFTVFGPYGYVGSSYFALIEAQTRHIVRCLDAARRRRATRVEVRREANDRYFAEMMRKRHRQIFWQDSCQLSNSYYFDQHGDVPLRPASTPEAYWRSRRFPIDDYEFSC
ncbi:NAD(P)/FAD-dependent oxidoreductase [Mycolicibacterium austroafricanum]|uniref:NAD(P)/FAD-dependent oxidoreductase n=1 Tax=Mycolicibacterium austroafricanum TaxID=39687 RepID=A0ABT8HLS0_MYCAO|nr:NAD(P)/FAD-dependent oxidoreductase [Mycolicibacterium austroafricanum]MDN4521707.1 NAD(P)/FAD-dependent oxidoreductase [Mycolicibacterium austroafricanum]QRZ09228.1 NAD(P)/FAD-dependent oxidoreductase [Mycolicibacterium austroafricanum]QZT71001.1 NAD(P)/FAD-dependent oxidoreductase [Mycolicibacterium austroafricanum]